MFTNNKISLRQLQVLLILDIFGTGITILPRTAAEFSEQDAWLLILFGTLLAIFCIYIMSSLSEMFPNDNFITYTEKLLSRPVAIIITIGFVLKIIFSLSMELKIFCEIINQTILTNTPPEVVCICMLLVGAYGAFKGYETRGRMAEILIYVTLIPIIFVFAIVAFDVDYTNLLPVLKSPKKNLFEGGFFSLFAFSGIEFILLAYPYLNNKKNAKKESIKAILFIGIFMTVITVITLAKFGPYEIKKQMWPVLEIMDTIDFPGSFVERQDALVMIFWIISVFIITNAGLFFSSLLLKDLFNKKFKKAKKIHYIFILLPVIFLISLLPKNVTETYKFINKIYLSFGTAYMVIIPLLLFIIAKLKKAGEIK